MRPWADAWQDALYSPTGFYHRDEGPAGHFRTAAHADAPALAGALTRLCAEVGATAVVDVGAGRGELLTALVGSGLRLHGVDVVDRPAGLAPSLGWSTGIGALTDEILSGALVTAWELLDVVPCPVLEIDGDGVPRQVLVDTTGREELGEPAAGQDFSWCTRWWPLDGRDEGDRIEVGLPRDRFWALLARRCLAGGATALLAVDYAHRRENRPSAGSLTGFAGGRAVPPRPDGTTDVTAHVAIDAVERAGRAAGATTAAMTTQADALRALGVTAPELLDPGGLGGFAWLLQVAGSPVSATREGL